MTRVLLLIVSLLTGLTVARGEQAPASVSFVTVYPGAEIYELEGHSALRVRTAEGMDAAVNFGLFDFDAPHFVWRFVKGETDYMAGVSPWEHFVWSYGGSGRKIVEQPLSLDSAATVKLMELLNRQLLPENRTYRYNYVLDNCATRPLGLVLAATGVENPELTEPQAEKEGCRTFREVMRMYHRNYPWYQFGIDLALGSLIDQPINRLQQSFAPVSLMEELEGSGLVCGETRVVAEGKPGGASDGPTPWILSPMAFALAVFAGALGVSIRDWKKKRMSRGFDAVFYGIYGLAGCVIAFLVFVSTHYATSPNLVLLWLNPFCLIPPIFIGFARTKKVVYVYQMINFAVLIGLIIAWPMSEQSSNAAFWPLIGADLVRSASYLVEYKRLNKR